MFRGDYTADLPGFHAGNEGEAHWLSVLAPGFDSKPGIGSDPGRREYLGTQICITFPFCKTALIFTVVANSLKKQVLISAVLPEIPGAMHIYECGLKRGHRPPLRRLSRLKTARDRNL